MKLELMNWFKRNFLFMNDEKGTEVNEKGLWAGSKIKFPCSSDNCLVRAACTQACDKLIMDETILMQAFQKHEACPDCGGESFREGPCGGAAQNIKCSSCGHWFNLGLPLFIQRIHMTSEGRFYD